MAAPLRGAAQARCRTEIGDNIVPIVFDVLVMLGPFLNRDAPLAATNYSRPLGRDREFLSPLSLPKQGLCPT